MTPSEVMEAARLTLEDAGVNTDPPCCLRYVDGGGVESVGLWDYDQDPHKLVAIVLFEGGRVRMMSFPPAA